MNYIVTRDNNSDELQHYGVIGMKWGVRRARKMYENATTADQRNKANALMDKHTNKAARKLEKLDKKVAKWNKKRAKAANPLIRTDASDARHQKAIRKADKYKAKADKWYKKVEKTMGKEKARTLVNSKGVRIGEKYADRILYNNF